MIRSLCVFCGSNMGSHPAYREAAVALGRLIVEQNLRLVYGGGNVGLMGVAADTVLEGGGEAVGVIPGFLKEKEVAHLGLSELHVVVTMHERKALMADLADAFVALPGGFGTFDELCEILTWTQLRIQTKPCGLLNVRGYFNGLLAQLDHAVKEGFLQSGHRASLVTEEDPAALLQALRRVPPVEGEKWADRGVR